MKKNNEETKSFQDLYIEGHRLKTRRDFLGQGLITGSAFSFLPGILSIIQSNTLYAQQTGSNCPTPQVNSKTPVIIFDLAGGANIPGSNVMVGGAGGQQDFLSTYTTLGLPPSMHPSQPGQYDTTLGLGFHSDSGFLRGIMSQTNATVQEKVDGAIFCASSSDDTGNNQLNPCYWLNRAGAQGGLAQLAGTRGGVSGGRSIAPEQSVNPAVQPVQLNRPEDALGLVNIGRLGQLFNDAKAQRILKAIERMSDQRIAAFQQRTLPDQIKQLVKCGYIGSQDLISAYNEEAIDPAQDNLVNQAFNNLGNGDQRKTATIAKLVLDGHVGVGTVEKGGYDYHNRTRSRGERSDLEAGELIGRVLSLAALKQTDVLIYVITDGGCTAREEIDDSNDGRGKYVWSGDSGQRSSTFMLLYRHAGRATLRNGVRQLGYFKTSGGVENSAMPASNSPTNLSQLLVANFMALHGEEGNLTNVVGSNPFSASLDQYLVFQQI